MMGDIKTRSVEKVQMKPKRKIIKTKSVKKQVESNERKNSESIEKWVTREKLIKKVQGVNSSAIKSCKTPVVSNLEKLEKKLGQNLKTLSINTVKKESNPDKKVATNSKIQNVVQEEMVLRGKVRKWDQFFDSKWPVVKKVSGMEENLRGEGLKTEKCQEKQTQPKTKPNLAKNKKRSRNL